MILWTLNRKHFFILAKVIENESKIKMQQNLQFTSSTVCALWFVVILDTTVQYDHFTSSYILIFTWRIMVDSEEHKTHAQQSWIIFQIHPSLSVSPYGISCQVLFITAHCKKYNLCLESSETEFIVDKPGTPDWFCFCSSKVGLFPYCCASVKLGKVPLKFQLKTASVQWWSIIMCTCVWMA